MSSRLAANDLIPRLTPFKLPHPEQLPSERNRPFPWSRAWQSGRKNFRRPTASSRITTAVCLLGVLVMNSNLPSGSGQLAKILPARTSQHAARASSTLEPEIRRLPGLQVRIHWMVSELRHRTREHVSAPPCQLPKRPSSLPVRGCPFSSAWLGLRCHRYLISLNQFCRSRHMLTMGLPSHSGFEDGDYDLPPDNPG